MTGTRPMLVKNNRIKINKSKTMIPSKQQEEKQGFQVIDQEVKKPTKAVINKVTILNKQKNKIKLIINR